MPPKPTPRAVSGSSNAEKDAMETMLMPPPPPPNPPASRIVLEAEATALATCLKNAAVKTGQIYMFFADTHKLGIQAHAPKPPRSLTASLGKEIEKYDQIIDAMEAHLNRAIAVLQRDLDREELKIRQEAEAALAVSSTSPTSKLITLPTTEGTPKQDNALLPTPSTSPRPSSSAGLRRPSAISISSLQRPNAPLKLDLSSSGLRMNPDEAVAMFSTGLASPVTLAPRSARPLGSNDFPADLMAFVPSTSNLNDLNERPVDIDLTLGEPDVASTATAGRKLAAVGNSADKPIELDLDMDIDMAEMNDLFGDTTESGANAGDKDAMNAIFNTNVVQMGDTNTSVKTEAAEFLDHAASSTNSTEDIFASFGVTGISQDLQQTKDEGTSAQAAPSPGTFIASLGATINAGDQNSNEAAFDIANLDFSGFSPNSLFGHSGDSDPKFMDMDQFLQMNSGPTEEGVGEKKAEGS